MGAMVSPLTGADGNVEFLVHARARPTAMPTAWAPTLRQRSTRRWPRWTDPGAASREGECRRGHRRLHRPPRARPGRRAGARRRGLAAPSGATTSACPLHDAAIAGLPDLGVRRGRPSLEASTWPSASAATAPCCDVDLVRPRACRCIGVNVGQLGYLTEVEPASLRMALKRFLAGSYDVEERMMLDVTVEAAGFEAEPCHLALNEAVLEKTPMGHTVRLGVSVDGEPFTTYAADGLIVATPTGSTAYAFSARGPIVEPTHRCLLLTPVSPHMLFDRSLVLAPDRHVRIEVLGTGRPRCRSTGATSAPCARATPSCAPRAAARPGS